MLPTHLSLLAGLCAALIPCSLFGQSVHVVDDDGGVDFLDIQAAVDAARDGDTILVRSGQYGDVFVLGKAVAIIADRGASVELEGSVQIRDVDSGRVVVHGVSARAVGVPALDVQDCAAPVLVSDSEFIGSVLIAHFSVFPGARISRSGAVTLVRCSVRGGVGLSDPVAVSSDGLSVIDSAVQLFDTDLVGGSGAFGTTGTDPAPGGAGLLVEDGRVHVQGGSVAGGAGGSAPMTILGCRNGAVGGTGAVLSGADTVVEIQGVSLSGGSGGSSAGTCSPGARGVPTEVLGGQLAPLAADARGLFVDLPVREGQAMGYDIRGEAGDLAVVAISRRLAATPLPFLIASGPLLIDTQPVVIVPIGTLPGSGSLRGSLVLRHMASGVDVATWFAQLLTVDTQFGFRLGNVEAVIILDERF